MRVDSCGIFVIGPWQCVRLVYDCTSFDIVAPHRLWHNSMVMEQLEDEEGKPTDERRYEVHQYTMFNVEQVHGFPQKSYLSKKQHERRTHTMDL